MGPGLPRTPGTSQLFHRLVSLWGCHRMSVHTDTVSRVRVLQSYTVKELCWPQHENQTDILKGQLCIRIPQTMQFNPEGPNKKVLMKI